MKGFIFIYYLLALSSFNFIYSQDVEFSQFYATRNYLNPAFSAITDGHNLATSYRNQWPSIPDSYNSNLVSYSAGLQKYGAGFSCYFLNDVAGVGSFRRQTFTTQVAKGIRLGKNIIAALGIRGGYNVNSIKWNKLRWGDMIDARSGFVHSTNQPTGLAKTSFFDISSGLILYSEYFHAGMVMEHLNEPEVGVVSYYKGSHLMIRYKLHLGGDFKIQYIPGKIMINISPQLIYMRQGGNKQLSIGTYVSFAEYKSKKKLVLGSWYRMRDSFILLLGVQSKRYRIGYSFDIGVNRLSSHSGGAHELSLSYSFPFSSKKKKFKSLACPYF